MYTGGKLHRLVNDNFYNMIHDALDAKGWFGAGRRHQPVQMTPETIEDNQIIPPYTIAVSDENINSEDIELGSHLSEHRYQMYIDVYAESRAIGIDLAGDIKDLLEGRMTAINRDSPSFKVYDLSVQSATPIELFTVQIDEVELRREREFSNEYKKYWYSVGCVLTHSYQSDLD